MPESNISIDTIQRYEVRATSGRYDSCRPVSPLRRQGENCTTASLLPYILDGQNQNHLHLYILGIPSIEPKSPFPFHTNRATRQFCGGRDHDWIIFLVTMVSFEGKQKPNKNKQRSHHPFFVNSRRTNISKQALNARSVSCYINPQCKKGFMQTATSCLSSFYFPDAQRLRPRTSRSGCRSSALLVLPHHQAMLFSQSIRLALGSLHWQVTLPPMQIPLRRHYLPLPATKL